MGNITQIKKDGVIINEYTYDAWGNILSITGSMASTLGNYNAFRYRGYYYDRETGFYYLNSRYYDPTVGRFLNADTLEYLGNSDSVLSYNLYAYCGNNPVRFADYEGEWLHIIAGAVVGAISSVASNIIQNTIEGNELNIWEIVGDAIVGASCGAVAAAGAPTIAATMQSCYDATKTVCEAYELNHDDKAENDKSVNEVISDVVIDTSLNFIFSSLPFDAGDDVAKIAAQQTKKSAKEVAKDIASETIVSITLGYNQYALSQNLKNGVAIYYQ